MLKQKTKDFTKAVRKINAINTLLNPNGCKRITGLAGPNPVECVARWVKAGFERITVYENDVDTFIRQDALLSRAFPHVNLVLGDILDYEPIENEFLDIDLCCSINKARNLEKFKENFLITFCLRPGRGHPGEGREWTEKKFVEMRGEKITESYLMTDIPHAVTIKEIVTDKGVYHTTSYRDVDSPPMLMITKI